MASSSKTEVGRVAYLVSQYPAYSHAFIDLEVQALRRRGWEVDTLSVQPPGIPGHSDSGSTLSSRAAPRTVLLGNVIRLVGRHPLASLRVGLRGIHYARRRGSFPLRVLWQIFYFVQAAFFFAAMRKRGLRHLHVHFANNAADIARLVADLGNLVGGSGRWTWSMQVHGPTDFRDAHKVGLTEKIASAAFVGAISEYAVSELRAYAGLADHAKISIIRMGVEPKSLAERPPARPSLRSQADVFKILFVGRLVPQKGPDVLLDALATIDAERPIELTIIGDGPLRTLLEHRAARLPGFVKVNFLGAKGHDEVLDWYAWADVFCLPSYSEGLPVVLMEALGTGLPAITTPVAGIPELVRHESTGLLVPPGSRADLAAALDRLRSSPALAQRLGQAGRSLVHQQYSVEKNAQALERLLLEALGQAPR